MKKFILRILAFGAFCIALFHGVLFFVIYSQRVAFPQAMTFYNDKVGVSIFFGTAIVFGILGLAFLGLAFKSTDKNKAINMDMDGASVRIPLDSIKEFINKSLGQCHSMSDFDASVVKHGKWVCVYVDSNVIGSSSIDEEINTVKDFLREELVRVFKFKYVKIEFNINNIKTYSEPHI